MGKKKWWRKIIENKPIDPELNIDEIMEIKIDFELKLNTVVSYYLRNEGFHINADKSDREFFNRLDALPKEYRIEILYDMSSNSTELNDLLYLYEEQWNKEKEKYSFAIEQEELHKKLNKWNKEREKELKKEREKELERRNKLNNMKLNNLTRLTNRKLNRQYILDIQTKLDNNNKIVTIREWNIKGGAKLSRLTFEEYNKLKLINPNIELAKPIKEKRIKIVSNNIDTNKPVKENINKIIPTHRIRNDGNNWHNNKREVYIDGKMTIIEVNENTFKDIKKY